MLEGSDSRAAMQQFLAGRKRWAEQLLEQALAECEQHGQEPGHVLAQLAQQVQCCISQVGVLGWLSRVHGMSCTRQDAHSISIQAMT